MAGIKFDRIYLDLKHRIENGEFPFQEMLPSEARLCEQYACSRNTVRRAITELASQGYLQSMHGKGVAVIHQPMRQSFYALGQIESFQETVRREAGEIRTRVVHFAEVVIDDAAAALTLLPAGKKAWYIQRVRYFDGKARIVDVNHFLKDAVPGLDIDIAKGSIYEYIEKTLGVGIVTTKRTITVERTTPLDEKYLDLDGSNCVAVVANHTFNDDGVMFEYTQSRHTPTRFVFHDQARRIKRPAPKATGKSNECARRTPLKGKKPS